MISRQGLEEERPGLPAKRIPARGNLIPVAFSPCTMANDLNQLPACLASYYEMIVKTL